MLLSRIVSREARCSFRVYLRRTVQHKVHTHIPTRGCLGISFHGTHCLIHSKHMIDCWYVRSTRSLAILTHHVGIALLLHPCDAVSLSFLYGMGSGRRNPASGNVFVLPFLLSLIPVIACFTHLFFSFRTAENIIVFIIIVLILTSMPP